MNVSTVVTPTSISSLTPYTGSWSRIHAGHLLRRATFAPLKSEIDSAINLGLEGTLDLVFANTPLPDPPVYYDYDGHPDAGIGDTWVDLPRIDNLDRNARRRSLEAWWVASMPKSSLNIRAKMAFFWHNHFGINGPGDPRAIYQFITHYHNHSTGDFRQLVKEMTVNPSMLVFLNGNSSTAANPNENFAREILELFTIGKGPQVGEGDYTNYTELDVAELAKAFTGWRTRNLNTTQTGEEPESYFQANRHDTSTKTLSHRFDNATIVNNGADEYKDVIDLIFQQDEVSRYICRKLYRYFVYYKIDDTVEANIIEPMAAILRANDYTIAPALRALLSSEHFYDRSIVGDIIKSPLELTISIFRYSGYFDQGNLVDDYQAARRASIESRNMGLDLTKPPSVAGWTAYYQEPSFFRLWLNTATLQVRTSLAKRSVSRNGFYWGNSAHPFDWLSSISRYSNPRQAVDLIRDMAEEFMPQPLADAQLLALRELLLPAIDDFVWTMEYADHIANPNDDELRMSVENRLKRLIEGMLQLAEFQVH